jgi:hypothetical protein
MRWPEVRRIAAYRSDVLTSPVLCVAITDPDQIVVLDESMEGWQLLLECISRYIVGERSFSEWRGRISDNSAESHWTILFRAGQ